MKPIWIVSAKRTPNGRFLGALAKAFLRLHPVDFERLRQNIRDCLQNARSNIPAGARTVLFVSLKSGSNMVRTDLLTL